MKKEHTGISGLVNTLIIVVFLAISAASCGKEPSVEETLRKHLTEHIRITNDVFYEMAKKSGKATTIAIVGPVKIRAGNDGKTAISDAEIEIKYISENSTWRGPVRVMWLLKEGGWAADKVLPEEFEFIISFNKATLERMKKGDKAKATKSPHNF